MMPLAGAQKPAWSRRAAGRVAERAGSRGKPTGAGHRKPTMPGAGSRRGARRLACWRRAPRGRTGGDPVTSWR